MSRSGQLTVECRECTVRKLQEKRAGFRSNQGEMKFMPTSTSPNKVKVHGQSSFAWSSGMGDAAGTDGHGGDLLPPVLEETLPRLANKKDLRELVNRRRRVTKHVTHKDSVINPKAVVVTDRERRVAPRRLGYYSSLYEREELKKLPPANKLYERVSEYAAYCNVCFATKVWCGFPHITDAKAQKSFRLSSLKAAKGESFQWLADARERQRIKSWNFRRVVTKPGAIIKMQTLIRGFLVRLFFRRTSSYISRKSTKIPWIRFAAAAGANERNHFFVTSMQTVFRGHLGRRRVKNMRSIQIQRRWRGVAARRRVKFLRHSIGLLQGSVKTSLMVQISAATNIPNADAGRQGVSDPFCVVSRFNETVGQTKVIQNSLDPCWDSEFFRICTSRPDLVPMSGIGNWFVKGIETIDSSSPVSLPDLLHLLHGGMHDTGLSSNTLVRHESTEIFMPVEDKDHFPLYWAEKMNHAIIIEREKAAEANTKKKSKKKKSPKKSKAVEKAPTELETYLTGGSEKVTVHIHSAKGLKKADGMFGKSDPYVKIFSNNKLVGKTKVIKKTLDPVWDEKLEFYMLSEGGKLRIEVFDYDLAGSHDFLGQMIIEGQELKAFLNQDNIMDYELSERTESSKKKVGVKGHVCLQATAQRAAPSARVHSNAENEVATQDVCAEENMATQVARPTQQADRGATTFQFKHGGKWYWRDPRNFEHIHGPQSLANLLLSIHRRHVHLERISELLVRHESVEYYLRLGAEDRFPEGWFRRSRQDGAIRSSTMSVAGDIVSNTVSTNSGGGTAELSFEVRDKDLLSSEFLGRATMTNLDIEAILHTAHENEDFLLGEYPQWPSKPHLYSHHLVLKNEDGILGSTKKGIQVRGKLAVTFKVATEKNAFFWVPKSLYQA